MTDEEIAISPILTASHNIIVPHRPVGARMARPPITASILACGRPMVAPTRVCANMVVMDLVCGDGAQKTMIAKQTAPHNGTVFHQAFPSGEGGMAKP